MLSAVERARVHVLQMASAERVAMDRWPEPGAVGAVKAHARRVRRSRLIRRTHLSHCVSRRASAPRRGRLSVGGFQICERAAGVVIPVVKLSQVGVRAALRVPRSAVLASSTPRVLRARRLYCPSALRALTRWTVRVAGVG